MNMNTETNSGRVLLIEDGNTTRDSLTNLLSHEGFYVQRERDAEQALQRLAREPFDVFLTDMATIDGSTTVRRALQTRPSLSVVLLVETPTNETSIAADELGALFCLAKSVDINVLARALLGVIERHGGRDHIMTHADRAWSETVGATEAKNEFSRVLELAIHRGPVRITKHQKPRAVLIEIDEFQKLTRARVNPLHELTSEFDTLLAQMQQPEAVAAMDALFDASTDDLNEVVVGKEVSN